jgi:hypothetical protein
LGLSRVGYLGFWRLFGVRAPKSFTTCSPLWIPKARVRVTWPRLASQLEMEHTVALRSYSRRGFKLLTEAQERAWKDPSEVRTMFG